MTNTDGRVITDLDTLLTWCEDDPVDTWEMKRNDLAQLQQENRNVFIDYPELSWKLFSREVPSGMQMPLRMLWILMSVSLILACFCGSVLKRAVDRI